MACLKTGDHGDSDVHLKGPMMTAGDGLTVSSDDGVCEEHWETEDQGPPAETRK